MFQRLGAATLAILLIGCGPATPTPSGEANGSAGPTGSTADPNVSPSAAATPVPTPGHELYGYVPYWEMDDTIADHLAGTTLTTLALFSITNKRDGTIDTGQNGYRRITGDLGRRMIAEAHARHVRVELVFTSFGAARNQQLFGGTIESQDKVIASLVSFAREIDVDGINVDVESMDLEFVASYGAFIARLRTALRGDTGKGQVSVATSAHVGGATMAAAASLAGADRIFLMGYDYHWAGSAPGASAPLDRRDGQPEDLGWSLDLYAGAGVPVERTILGLPLYGMVWPVSGPELGAPDTGRGDTWIPSDHLSTYADTSLTPTFDPIEQVDMYAVPDDDPEGQGWKAVYVDSPATLTPKLALADAHGLAGAGLWAVGYERGRPGYTDLFKQFAEGKLD